MIKQAVVFYDSENKPLQVCEIRTFDTPLEFSQFEKECKANLSTKQATYEKLIADLTKRLELVELELKYNRGEIDDKEYEELCGKK